MTALWWIRRDLRLTDNPALHAALEAGPVLPVFILDPAFSSSSPRRKNFLYEGLHALNRDLRQRNSYLVTRNGSPLETLRTLLAETGATAIFAEEDFTPYARERDAEIARHLPLQLIHGQTVHHPELIKKADGTPYTVYTPYSKAWKSLLGEIHPLPAPDHIPTPAGIHTDPLPPFTVSPDFPAGEAEALRRLETFCSPLPVGDPLTGAGGSGVRSITNYHDHRNRLDLDGTSSLSPYIRFGMISLRQAVHAHTPLPLGEGPGVRAPPPGSTNSSGANSTSPSSTTSRMLPTHPSTPPLRTSRGGTRRQSSKRGRGAKQASLW